MKPGTTMNEHQILHWLLEGDVSIRFQVCRDLLGKHLPELQNKIATQGWGQQILLKRQTSAHWGDRFYQPKWISTHYTLLDLKNLNLPPNNDAVKETIALVLKNEKAEDGGIALGPSTSQHSDVCVNGMFLNYASYFNSDEKQLHSVIDSLLNELMPDGGFNCRTSRSGAIHSSLHSTISVLEGLTEFKKAGFTYRIEKIDMVIKSAIGFILQHHLFQSDKTGQIIHKDFIKLHYPCRWKYDILRALDYFQNAMIPWDERMLDAINVLLDKRMKQGVWNLSAAYPGQVHVSMEKAGEPSRWNTLRCLRVLKYYNKIQFDITDDALKNWKTALLTIFN